MFDVGFLELGLIGVVALLVIGPERLPKVARTVGMWVGRAQRMVSSVKRDIEQELQAEKLRESLEKGNESRAVHEIIEETKKSFTDIKQQTEAAAGTHKPSDKSSDSSSGGQS